MSEEGRAMARNEPPAPGRTAEPLDVGAIERYLAETSCTVSLHDARALVAEVRRLRAERERLIQNPWPGDADILGRLRWHLLHHQAIYEASDYGSTELREACLSVFAAILPVALGAIDLAEQQRAAAETAHAALGAVVEDALQLAAMGRYYVCTDHSLSERQGRDTPEYQRLVAALPRKDGES